MLVTNATASDYYFGPLHLPAGVGQTLTVDDTSATSLYLLDDNIADAINDLAANGKITVSGQASPFPRPTGTPAVLHGDGSPEGRVFAGQGSIYLTRTVGSAANFLYTKTSGVSFNTGWVAINPGTPTVATTVAGLGAAVDGKQGRLRLGSSPFDFIDLMYDATYGKWVSPEQPVTTAVGTVTAIQDYWNFGSYSILWKPYLSAGLTPQFYVSGRTRGAAASVNDVVGFEIWHISSYTYPAAVPNDLTSLQFFGEQRAQTTANEWVGFGDYPWSSLTVPGSPKDLMVASCNATSVLGNVDVALTLHMRWVG